MGKEKDRSKQALASVAAKRDYILPYHRMLAETDPDLLEAYDSFYDELALQPRTLPGSEKELVWTGLLVTTRRGVGTYHLRRGVEAGLTAEQFAAAATLAGAATTFFDLQFADEAFGDWLPDGAMMANYDDAIARARGPLSAKTAWLIVATCHASHEQFDALAYDIRRFFGAGGIRAELAEALSYLLLHRGGPHLINSLNVWRDVAKEVRCEGPYDEAS